MRDAIGSRVAGHIETVYAYQSLERCLPEGYSVPEGRIRPWGTAHALLCCRDVLDGPFAMINADDFYGAGAFRMMYSALREVDTSARPMRFSMVGYRLGNTVTDSGRVCRGACPHQRRQARFHRGANIRRKDAHWPGVQPRRRERRSRRCRRTPP